MRDCDGCTLCCRGTLTLQAKEHKVYPGHPCPYMVDDGCGIHKDPSKPECCDSYLCVWLENPDMPEWMKPDKVGFLMTEANSYVILTADFASGQIDGTALLYAIDWCKVKKKPMFYTAKSPMTGEYVRGSIMAHPDSTYRRGSMDEIFEPIELFNDG
jgi:hypothetical protein